MTPGPLPAPVEADVPMRDGVALRADVHADATARPVLLLRSPTS